MPSYRGRPGLAAFEQALATGDVEAARSALFALIPEERDILAAQLGQEELARLSESARRARRRGPPQGRVIVLPGLMGTQLDSVDAGGDADRVWVNLGRIFQGRLAELALSFGGDPLPPPHTVQTASIFPLYTRLLFELHTRWEIRAFPFDWRLDIDKSAAALAELVRDWGQGQPVHLMAHSTGGLVARRFLQLFPEVWRSMQDPAGQGRGGRLVMMGTPNRGSFAIVLALSGEEKIVRMLDKIDQFHDGAACLRILNSFHASYQHLPAPRVDLGDDHVKLFNPASWGALPVSAPLIARGRAFQDAIYPVVDPDRLLYVAGYDQDTPVQVRIERPGVFTYKVTRDGDGRVPHVLGLLDGVRTFWVREKHGDLPKNSNVLAAVHDLLLKGTTTALESQKPAGRALRADGPYLPPKAIEVQPATVELLTRWATAGRRRPGPSLTDVETARLEALMLRDYVGTPVDSIEAAAAARTTIPTSFDVARARRPSIPQLRVEVVWGDITKAVGDAYAVGHYQGVLPQRAELALDRAVSGRSRHLMIADQTRRGIVRGAVGDVDFFPWGKKVVAVAGMGYAGTFGQEELRRLVRSLIWAVMGLPQVKTLCSVLVGSGEGTLDVDDAVWGLFLGLADALTGNKLESGIGLLRLVERQLDRAHQIHDALEEIRRSPVVAAQIDIVLVPKIRPAPGGCISVENGLALLIAAAAKAIASRPRSAARNAVNTLLRALPRRDDLPERLVKILAELGHDKTSDLGSVARSLRVQLGPAWGAPSDNMSTRVSFLGDSRRIRVAAITETATVPERDLDLDLALVDELIGRMTDPDPAKLPELADLLRRLLVPADFADKIRAGPPLVLEVDRTMARVQWEMMAADSALGSPPEPLGLRTPMSRQLRTTYSPPPSPGPRPASRLRALVVGDPGDPDLGHSLPGARREAQRVAEILRNKNVDVIELIGAPDAAGAGPLPGIPAASRIDVLHHLLTGGFDLLHYCGHGDFDAARPDSAGWVFKGGLLTSHELQRMAFPPRLVVANACLSGLTSGVTVQGEAALLPSLAEGFFRRGVRDYIGTAWEVIDEGAIRFAETFYEALLPDDPAEVPGTYGPALLLARQKLAAEAAVFGLLWAAYQHYGDPTGLLARWPQPPGERVRQ